MCIFFMLRGCAPTLFVNVLVGQLALVANKVAEDAGEEVPVTGTASVARGVLGGTAQVVVIVAPEDLAAGGHCREGTSR